MRFDVIASLSLLAATVAAAQPLEPARRAALEQHAARTAPALGELRRANFRLDVKLIQVPVTVTDMRDHAVMGLGKQNFRVFEDDVEQQVTAFSMGDAPISTGVVFDTSGSMHNHIGETHTAIVQFLKTTIPGDEFFLMRFSDIPELMTPMTSSADEIERKLSSLRPQGWTAMNDAIYRSIGEMRHAINARRVLLVLTDGVDNNSRYSDGELFSLAREADAAIFAIGLFERPRFLEKLADETGGRVIWVHKLNELPDAMERLSTQIRNQYVLGYFSSRAQNDGRYHKVRVEVSPPAETGQVRATWRKGYSAP